jgi:predicted ATP-grasp superfamily ATP-dependent carboligase
MSYRKDNFKSRGDLIRHLVDATDAKTSDEIDRTVCYPVPPPDSQPIAVSWGVLRQLTDLPAEVAQLKEEIEQLKEEIEQLKERSQ